MIEPDTTESRPCANFSLNFLYPIRIRALTLNCKSYAGLRDRALRRHREAARYKTARLRRSPSTLQSRRNLPTLSCRL
jgi:hypothetical protein